MMLSRRSAASVLAGLPFVGGAAAKAVAGAAQMPVGAGQAMPPDCPYPSKGQINAAPKGPMMPEWKAAQIAMLDPHVRDIIIASAYAQNKIVPSVDPDIEIYRSFSPMAKITFQRQRNVERAIKQATEEPMWSLTDKAQAFIRKLMWGS